MRFCVHCAACVVWVTVTVTVTVTVNFLGWLKNVWSVRLLVWLHRQHRLHVPSCTAHTAQCCKFTTTGTHCLNTRCFKMHTFCWQPWLAAESSGRHFLDVSREGVSEGPLCPNKSKHQLGKFCRKIENTDHWPALHTYIHTCMYVFMYVCMYNIYIYIYIYIF